MAIQYRLVTQNSPFRAGTRPVKSEDDRTLNQRGDFELGFLITRLQIQVNPGVFPHHSFKLNCFRGGF